MTVEEVVATTPASVAVTDGLGAREYDRDVPVFARYGERRQE
ncbi:hypothetical protein [Halomarina oriensis]|nr:hypothetical protein [Halomarina oriensis]